MTEETASLKFLVFLNKIFGDCNYRFELERKDGKVQRIISSTIPLYSDEIAKIADYFESKLLISPHQSEEYLLRVAIMGSSEEGEQEE